MGCVFSNELVAISCHGRSPEYLKLFYKYGEASYLHLLMTPCLLHGSINKDNAPIYVSRDVHAWPSSNSIQLNDWPSQSSDLIPIENLWEWMAKSVYENNQQFESISVLTNRVMKLWDEIPAELPAMLLQSMHNRTV